ncbi:hypothetical protein LCGC14_2241340 [marine sediment metagenome]|uniref:LamG-like jellyroll fold domain-containing protein n=1 Tax=marine sediment metagenome TaxID=412755 RepID=A0A0F9DSX9_9ZZZZ
MIIAHYKLNDNAATDTIIDETGNHNGAVKDAGGTATSAFHSTANSRGVGTCLDFEGTDDHIEIADHADFSPVLTPFSISAWVYMHTATYFVWASKWQVGSNREWNIYTGTPKKINFRMYDNSENASIGRLYNTSLASYEGKWTHFVATYDGGILSSGIKIYLNGNRVDDADSESGNFISVENLTAPVYIGRYDTKYADGLIDNVIIFNQELNLDEVKALYNGGHGTEIVAVIDIDRRIQRRSI